MKTAREIIMDIDKLKRELATPWTMEILPRLVYQVSQEEYLGLVKYLYTITQRHSEHNGHLMVLGIRVQKSVDV